MSKKIYVIIVHGIGKPSPGCCENKAVSQAITKKLAEDWRRINFR